MATARVRIDGLSLYYGAVKGTAYRWLDLCQLADFILDNDNVEEVHYYVSLDPAPGRRARQETFLRALQTLDRLSIHQVDPRDPVRQLGEDLHAYAAEVGTEEVSLVVSDDGRLAEALGACWPEHKHLCGVATPSGRFHPVLREKAKFKKRIGRAMLAGSVFPDVVFDADGNEIHKPDAW